MSTEYTAAEEGYAFVYLSNENPEYVEVYFDDFKVTQTKTNILQYNEYYPFGLQASTSWTRDNNSNNFLYNGPTETNTTTGLIETMFRSYDPALGRFMQVDPLAHTDMFNSSYNYAGNNPISLNDPSGLKSGRPGWLVALIGDNGQADFYSEDDYHPSGGSGGGSGGNGNSASNIDKFWTDILNLFNSSTEEKIEIVRNQNGDLGYYQTVFHDMDMSSEDWNGLNSTNYTGTPIVAEKFVSVDNQDHEYHQWNDLTGAEKNILAQNPGIVFQLQENQQLAYNMTSKYFTSGSMHNTSADAFRHAYFSALNTRNFGYSLAKQLGDAHEAFPNNPALEKQMDLFNNRVGRIFGQQYGAGYSNENIAVYLYNAVVTGKMEVIYGPRLGPSGK